MLDRFVYFFLLNGQKVNANLTSTFLQIQKFILYLEFVFSSNNEMYIFGESAVR